MLPNARACVAVILALLLIVWAAPSFANDPTPRLGIQNPAKGSFDWENAWYGFTSIVDGMASGTGTYAQRTACSTSYKSQLYGVTDCFDETCEAGSGTIACMTRCRLDGTAWEVLMCSNAGSVVWVDQGNYLEPAGGESVRAPIQDKGGQVYNVLAYGAIPDDSIDDTDEIQVVVDLASGPGNGEVCGTVYFPPGTYNVGQSTFVTLKPCVRIVGSSAPFTGFGTVIQGTAGKDIFRLCEPTQQGTPNPDCPDYYSPYTIENLTFSGGEHQLVSRDISTFVTIRDVMFNGPVVAGIHIQGCVEEWRVDNVSFSGGQYGVFLEHVLLPGSTCNQNYIDKSTFSNVITGGQTVNNWRWEVDYGGTTTFDNVILNTAGEHAFYVNGSMIAITLIDVNSEGTGYNPDPTLRNTKVSTGTTTATSTCVDNVASMTDWVVGEPITVRGAGASGYDHSSTVTELATCAGADSITMTDAAVTTVGLRCIGGTNADVSCADASECNSGVCAGLEVTNMWADDFYVINTEGRCQGAEFRTSCSVAGDCPITGVCELGGASAYWTFVGGAIGGIGPFNTGVRYAINGTGLSAASLIGMSASRPVYDPSQAMNILGGNISLRQPTGTASEGGFQRTVLGGSGETKYSIIHSPPGKDILLALRDSDGDSSGAFGSVKVHRSDSNRTQILKFDADDNITGSPDVFGNLGFRGFLQPGWGVDFASLGAPASGYFTYCADCTENSDPCTGSGNGAWAARLGNPSRWICGLGDTAAPKMLRISGGTFAEGDATPSVAGYSWWSTWPSTPATEITNFDNPVVAQIIYVQCNDTITSFDFGHSTASNLWGNGNVDWTCYPGKVMSCVYTGYTPYWWICNVAEDSTFESAVQIKNGAELYLWDADNTQSIRHRAAASITADVNMEWGDDLQNCTTGEVLKVFGTAGSPKVVTLECNADVGDSVTVNSSAAVDTTANLLDGDIDWTLVDGGVGGPDSITGTVACTGCVGVIDLAGESVSIAELDDGGGEPTGGEFVKVKAGGTEFEYVDTLSASTSKNFSILNPTDAHDAFGQLVYPSDVTLVEIRCSTDQGTVAVSFDERAEETPNTPGTNVLTSLVCDSSSESVASFSDANIVADAILNMDVITVSTSPVPTVVRVHVRTGPVPDSKNFSILNPNDAHDQLDQLVYAYASTLTEVRCSTDQGTVTISFDERGETTPNTQGTTVLNSNLVCDSNSQSTSSFTNAGIAADAILNMNVEDTDGTPGIVRIHVRSTVN